MLEVYETEALKTFERILQNWNVYTNKCICLHGEVGVGKTFTLEHMSKKNNYRLVSFYDDMNYDEILRIAATKPWIVKLMIIHLDRPLRQLRFSHLKRIIEHSVNPIVIECENRELKYYSHLTCIDIPVYPPPKSWIVSQVKKVKEVEKPNYKNITSDVRQAILIAKGSEGYRVDSWYDEVEKYFKTGDVSGLDKSHLPVLLDTGLTAFYGVKLFEFIENLILFDLSGNPEVMKGLRPSFKNYDIKLRYYEKLKALRGE